MNPKQMKQAMKKMGITQQDLEAEEVIIRQADRDLVISNPEVAYVEAMGQQSFQIQGTVEERPRGPSITEEDIQTVVEQTGVEKDIARQAIEDADGDLAEAIMALQEDS